ncbi:MAG: ATP synthase F1 subunit gamma [Proteobacteria bacterium]|nr:ATP synthase F1 subunit gamma [Pseudomonadota bacterium]
MSGLKTIRRRITSVKNTKQITRAMKLVSAAKLRRAQEAATSGQSYVNKLQRLLSEVIKALPAGYSSSILRKPDVVKKRRVLMISGERGLCGAYNNNVLKAAVAEKEQADDLGIEIDFFPIGKQAVTALKRQGYPTWNGNFEMPESAANWPVTELAATLIESFVKEEFDELVILYTKFVSTMTQRVNRDLVLPFQAESIESVDSSELAEFAIKPKFDPKPEIIMHNLLNYVLGVKIQQSGLESKASEHAARMTAMDSATRNADDLIEKLKLFYNRARQTAITRELIDIVGGAEATK